MRLRGRRVEFYEGFPKDGAQPGDYCKVPPGIDPRGDHVWYAVGPDGKAGAIVEHEVTEHEDGTISCFPSLVMPTGWHGFLQFGVWSG